MSSVSEVIPGPVLNTYFVKLNCKFTFAGQAHRKQPVIWTALLKAQRSMRELELKTLRSKEEAKLDDGGRTN